jgi:hypothetical protein
MPEGPARSQPDLPTKCPSAAAGSNPGVLVRLGHTKCLRTSKLSMGVRSGHRLPRLFCFFDPFRSELRSIVWLIAGARALVQAPGNSHRNNHFSKKGFDAGYV